LTSYYNINPFFFFFSPSNFDTANEICDKFAAAGFYANMITYLTQQLNLPLVKASNTLTNFGGMGSFTPLIGALIADSYAGRYWTIIGGSIIYELVTSSHPLCLSQR
jgi:peptide/histidine transporter 3/4